MLIDFSELFVNAVPMCVEFHSFKCLLRHPDLILWNMSMKPCILPIISYKLRLLKNRHRFNYRWRWWIWIYHFDLWFREAFHLIRFEPTRTLNPQLHLLLRRMVVWHVELPLQSTTLDLW